jgi:hypothetical protein
MPLIGKVIIVPSFLRGNDFTVKEKSEDNLYLEKEIDVNDNIRNGVEKISLLYSSYISPPEQEILSFLLQLIKFPLPPHVFFLSLFIFL